MSIKHVGHFLSLKKSRITSDEETYILRITRIL